MSMETGEMERLSQEELEFLQLLGYILMMYGKWNRAAAIYDALDILMPDNFQIRKAQALTCLNTGQNERALEKIEELLENSAPPSERKNLLIMKARALWNLGKRNEAAASLQEIIETDR